MKRAIAIMLGLQLLGLYLIGCVPLYLSPPAVISPDLQATIVEGVRGTAAARTPTPLLVTETLLPTLQATFTISPSLQSTPDYNTLDATELGYGIEQDINRLAAIAEQLQTYYDQAAVDGEITDQESGSIQDAIRSCLQASVKLESHLSLFVDRFGEIAAKSADDLKSAIEQNSQISKNLSELQQESSTGIAAFESLLTQTDNLSNNLQVNHLEWFSKLQDELELGVIAVQNITPDNVPLDKIAAQQKAFEYYDKVNEALLDEKITHSELDSIARLGANTVAGLKIHGSVKLQNICPEIQNITRLLAMGEMAQVAKELPVFASLLGKRPVFPVPATSIPTGAMIQIQATP